MTTEQPTLDPNIEEVLRDVAKDERSSLFVTTPHLLLKGLRGANACFEQRHVTRSKPEQHLIRTYGAELGRYLRGVVVRWRLEAAPRSVHPSGPIRVARDPVDSLLASYVSAEGIPGFRERELIGQQIGELDATMADRELRALGLAMRIDSSPYNIDQLIVTHHSHRRFKTSTRMARRALSGPLRGPRYSPFALQNLGVGEVSLGEPQRGLGVLKESIESFQSGGVFEASTWITAGCAAVVAAELLGAVEPCAEGLRALDSVPYDRVRDQASSIASKWLTSLVGDELRASIQVAETEGAQIAQDSFVARFRRELRKVARP